MSSPGAGGGGPAEQKCSTGCRRGSTRRCRSRPSAVATSTSTTGADASGIRRLEAAGIASRGPYHLRHTFATEALAAGISIFELAGLMGSSVQMIDSRYGHLARHSEATIRARLDARAARSGVGGRVTD
jgi:integrase